MSAGSTARASLRLQSDLKTIVQDPPQVSCRGQGHRAGRAMGSLSP